MSGKNGVSELGEDKGVLPENQTGRGDGVFPDLPSRVVLLARGWPLARCGSAGTRGPG